MQRSISKFEKQFECVRADTLNDIEDWFLNRGSDYSFRLFEASKSGSTGTLSNARIADFDIRVLRWGDGIAVGGTCLVDHGTTTISIPLSGYSEVLDTYFGKAPCHVNQARIHRRDAGTVINSEAGYSFLNLTLPTKLLEARARSYFSNELNGALRFSPIIDLNSAKGRSIGTLINYLLTLATELPSGHKNELSDAAVSEYLVSSVLGTLDHNYADPHALRIDCAAPRSVMRAESYMRAHADTPVTVEVLAREAGCSERALQNAFKAFRSTTPMAALREIRLEMAHRDLEEAANTVTEIAFKWGFTNLGRFSRLYEEKFGRKPSQTLR